MCEAEDFGAIDLGPYEGLFPHIFDSTAAIARCPFCGRPLDPGRVEWRRMTPGARRLTATQVVRCPEGCCAIRLWFPGQASDYIRVILRALGIEPRDGGDGA
ncbi:MAG: hypothetical protein QJR08_03845 [Bacillota bacterium]|nr:hypothetical protein [Bacillota bacterium]